MINILTSTDANYSQVTTLDGVDYLFTFRYCAREQRWRFDLSDINSNLLVSNIAVICGIPLLRLPKSYLTGLPSGEIYAYDSTGLNYPPTQYELGVGKRVVMKYVTLADLQSAL